MTKEISSKKDTFKSLILPVIVLVAICTVIGAAMAAINYITEPKIEEARREKEIKALDAVIPENNGFTKLEISDLPEGVSAVYSDNGSDCLAIMLSVKGYDSSNPMSVAVGFDGNGEIIKCSVISCAGETKGIGSKVADDGFLSLFVGKKDVSSVDTISGATISSTAFKEAVEDACIVVADIRTAEVTK